MKSKSTPKYIHGRFPDYTRSATITVCLQRQYFRFLCNFLPFFPSKVQPFCYSKSLPKLLLYVDHLVFLTKYIYGVLGIRIQKHYHMASLKSSAVLVYNFIQLFLLCSECSLKCQSEVPFTTVKVSLF